MYFEDENILICKKWFSTHCLLMKKVIKLSVYKKKIHM